MSGPDTTNSNAPSRAAFSSLEVVFVDLEAARDGLETAEAAVPRLSTADIVRAGRLADSPEHQGLWRAARIATRIVLERAAGPRIRQLDFIIAEGGRPALGQGLPCFNVSHSGAAALIAVSQSDPVGVDIEHVRPLAMTQDRRQRIIAAAARRGEGPALDRHSDADVLRAWVRLEAAAKAQGSGIGHILTEDGVIGGGRSSARMASRFAIRDLDVPPGYVAALAGERLPVSIEVKPFPLGAEALATFLAPSGSAP